VADQASDRAGPAGAELARGAREPARARLLAVLGPTASGKSALALALAARLGGEIISCDSQQVYVGMDLGTAKATREERRAVPHHLLDVVRPDEPFHAGRWAALARAAILDVAARGRVPIVVGGTGLYYRALTGGLFDAPAPDADIRERHRALAAQHGVEALHGRLRTVDPEAAAAVGPRDLVRISRALEVYEQTGLPITVLRRQAPPPDDLAPFAVVLDPSTPVLRERIGARVAHMIADGFEDEVRALRAAGYSPLLRPMQSLGYKQMNAVLDGTCALPDAIAQIVAATVAYARRQRTWFRKQPAAQHLSTAVQAGEAHEIAAAVAAAAAREA
jgi:tRNA dimethylallyltransferase